MLSSAKNRIFSYGIVSLYRIWAIPSFFHFLASAGEMAFGIRFENKNNINMPLKLKKKDTENSKRFTYYGKSLPWYQVSVFLISP